MDSNLFPQLPGQCYTPGRAIKATPRFEESVWEQPRPLSSGMAMQYPAPSSPPTTQLLLQSRVDLIMSGKREERTGGAKGFLNGPMEEEEQEEQEESEGGKDLHMRGGGTICDLCVGICAGGMRGMGREGCIDGKENGV
ncbi:uncharacterized protein EAE97_005158 [Botrytis byssoidea]|uniref:Uncharacterized protein n=1 Tax=Botrytis byssoidea TaxID=139641 RepID=A0A9P5IJX9_9HELO|nr:uncharacterized protein EAE97_005158 [Botrytis byssoidea]KAF7944525.1 hypothetical protein EAE97_005158 [Botrytis byssoidea]